MLLLLGADEDWTDYCLIHVIMHIKVTGERETQTAFLPWRSNGSLFTEFTVDR